MDGEVEMEEVRDLENEEMDLGLEREKRGRVFINR